MEAWERQDDRIELDDFIQRMAFVEVDHSSGEIHTRVYRMLVHRKEVARKRMRCLSWKTSNRTVSVYDEQLLMEVSRNPQWVNGNTTEYLRDLSSQEDAALK
jgi:hypothetical protein